MRKILTLNRPNTGAGSVPSSCAEVGKTTHPLLRYLGKRVIVQAKASGVRYTGRIESISHGIVVLAEGAQVFGTRQMQ